MVSFFFCNICGKCPNIPHHYKDSYLKQQQPHLFCLWHSLLINHLLSPKSWWRNMCSCSADWAGSVWQYQTTEILKQCPCKAWSPKQCIYHRLGRSWGKHQESHVLQRALVVSIASAHLSCASRMKRLPHCGVPMQLASPWFKPSWVLLGYHISFCIQSFK